MSPAEANAILARGQCPRCVGSPYEGGDLVRQNTPQASGFVSVWWLCLAGHMYEAEYDFGRHEHRPKWREERVNG